MKSFEEVKAAAGQLPKPEQQKLVDFLLVALHLGVSKNPASRDASKQQIEKPTAANGVVAARVTNIDPMPPELATQLYSQDDDDSEAIRLFMAAQVTSVDQ